MILKMIIQETKRIIALSQLKEMFQDKYFYDKDPKRYTIKSYYNDTLCTSFPVDSKEEIPDLEKYNKELFDNRMKLDYTGKNIVSNYDVCEKAKYNIWEFIKDRFTEYDDDDGYPIELGLREIHLDKSSENRFYFSRQVDNWKLLNDFLVTNDIDIIRNDLV